MSKKIANLLVVDNSGSMSPLRQMVVSGFNEQVETIRSLDKQNGTESIVGLVYFDSSVNVKFAKKQANEVELLTLESYVPSGGTAFYDGLAIAIKTLEDALGGDLSETEVVVTTITDGEENSSRKYAGSQLADLIKQFQDDYGWTFSFIGANIDTEKLATSLNVSATNAINFAYSAEGAKAAFDTLKVARSMYYSKKLSDEDTKTMFFTDTQK